MGFPGKLEVFQQLHASKYKTVNRQNKSEDKHVLEAAAREPESMLFKHLESSKQNRAQERSNQLIILQVFVIPKCLTAHVHASPSSAVHFTGFQMRV